MAYKFASAKCVNCHQKLPKGDVEPTNEIDIFMEETFKVGPCPKCSAEQRLVEVSAPEPD